MPILETIHLTNSAKPQPTRLMLTITLREMRVEFIYWYLGLPFKVGRVRLLACALFVLAQG